MRVEWCTRSYGIIAVARTHCTQLVWYLRSYVGAHTRLYTTEWPVPPPCHACRYNHSSPTPASAASATSAGNGGLE